MQERNLDANDIEYSKYTIHIVDDSPLVITSLENILKPKKYIINSSSNGKEALEAISHKKPDLIILDIEMPVMNGYETIQKLKENKKTKNIPVIFLTALSKPDIIKKIFNLGASDYITKPFVVEEMLSRIEKEIKNIMLQTLLKEKMSKLAELLYVDPLTKASNKMHMTFLIKSKLQKIQNGQNKSFTLMYLDIDDFNNFIRVNGIDSNDSAIKKIAMIIKRSISDKDIVAHWHGDKFMICFYKISKEKIDVIAKDIRDKISKTLFNSSAHLTSSICIAQISKCENIATLIDRIENSMKDSKVTNRSSIVKIMDFAV
ncbi:response regulator [Sulfurimonas sp.]|uniref:response regulator n=1 Tax=Sulfurimonas sp. TaxID=2022749 RepID=UPI0025D13CA3|nr:response regulator [Sulfurimonas sp.]